MTPHILHIVHQMEERIDGTRRALHRRELMTAGLKAISFAVLLGAVFLLIESMAESGSRIRTIFVLTYGMISAAVSVWLIWKPLLSFLGILRTHSDGEIARMIGTKFLTIADRLENMLELSETAKKGELTGSPELFEVALEHFGKSTARINFTETISFRNAQHLALIIAMIGITFAALTAIPGTPFHGSAERLWNYDREFTPVPIFTFSVTPGNIDVVKGEPVTIQAAISDATEQQTLPEEIGLLYSYEGVEVPEQITLRKDTSGYFRYQFPPMKQTMQYRLFAGEITSDMYRITVVDRPFIRSLAVTLIPPSYTKLQRETLGENVGDILALPGTKIIWNITPSKEIAQASIVFKDGSDIPLKKNGSQYIAEFSILNPSSYFIELEDVNGNTNRNNIEYTIKLLQDDYPTISILYPGKNIDVTEAMLLPMEFKVGDDFGISRVHLAFRLVESKYSQSEKEYRTMAPFDTITANDDILHYHWDLSLLGLVPEDVVEYYAEVQDNDPVNGPKSTKTQTYLIRLPSMEEIFSETDKVHDDISKTLEESLKEAQELKKDLQELSDDLKRNQQVDWQKQKKAEDVSKKYEEIQKKIDNVNKTVDEMTQNLQRNNTLSKETLEKYLELQKTLSEMNSPEFQKAMKRMQDAMQNVSPDQLREAMQQVQFSEEQFRQSIERTMNLLKRIQIEQKVDELLKRTEQMKESQDEVNKQTEALTKNDPQKADELAKKQDEIARQLSDVRKEMNDLQKKMEEFPKEMPKEKMDDAQNAANDPDMQNAMKQSSQQIRSLQTERAMASQKQASGGINEMQQQLSELQEQLLNNQMQQTMNALRKSMQDLLQISQKQEQLKNQSRTLDPNSQQFREMAQQQQNLQGDLNNVANSLSELSQQSFVVTPEMGKQIGRAMGQMEQAMNGIEQRNGPTASSMQNEAMASLNKAATQMQQAMQSMQQQGGQGGGSLMQQLRGMAMQQQQINAQTEQLGEQEGTSQQQLQEMGRLARQQDAVRKSLEQLQREAEGTPEKNKVMGDLDKIADEMKEVVEQLQQNEINPNTRQQQERILSRLLQAQRSMRERDYEKQRKAASGISPTQRNPAALSVQTIDSRLQRDLQRAEEAGYSRDYLEIIRKYYEALEQKQQQ